MEYHRGKAHPEWRGGSAEPTPPTASTTLSGGAEWGWEEEGLLPSGLPFQDEGWSSLPSPLLTYSPTREPDDPCSSLAS